MGFPQVSAGENPLLGATDSSRGRELTPEWEIKLGVGTRLPMFWAEMPTGPAGSPKKGGDDNA